MKVVLTGSRGALGNAIKEKAAIIGVDIVPLVCPRGVISEDFLHSVSASLEPGDILIHAAANTNVEHCEAEPKECYSSNYFLPELLSSAARKSQAKLVFISSTGVYGTGKVVPYCEFDIANPTTHHHKAKLLAEEAVLTQSPANLVVRTGWLFGGNVANPKNFVARRIEEGLAAFREGRSLSSNQSQMGNPTWVDSVADRLFLLLERDCSGVFNCVNSGFGSRFDYVSAVLDAAGVDLEVLPTSASSFKRLAAVSDNEMALNWKMECLGMPVMPDWKEQLRSYVSSIKSEVFPHG